MKSRLSYLVLVLAIAVPGSAWAGKCGEMRKTHSQDELWICRLAYNDGMPIVSRVECFADMESGRAWLGERLALSKGQILKANCMRQRTMMNWMKDPMPATAQRGG
jgi:hypothetical protein